MSALAARDIPTRTAPFPPNSEFVGYTRESIEVQQVSNVIRLHRERPVFYDLRSEVAEGDFLTPVGTARLHCTGVVSLW